MVNVVLGLFLSLEALLGCLTRLRLTPHFLDMGDPKWDDCFVPVMSEAISALSCFISGELFDKLLQRRLITSEQYDQLRRVAGDTRSSQSEVARELFTILKRRPTPSFDN